MKIYTPTGRAREYSPFALNYFKGECPHRCIYCYVQKLDASSKGGIIPPDEDDFKELEASAKSHRKRNEQILLCFINDPYCGVHHDATRRVLQILNNYEHKVSILTKGGKQVLEDIELFKQFKSNDLFTGTTLRIIVGATLTFDNDEDSLKWEPGAALPQERIESLRTLANEGIRTWVSFEPVLYPGQSLNLLQQVSSFVDFVKIGKVNDFGEWDKKIDWDDFIEKAVTICRKANLKFYIKNDLAKFNRNTVLYPEERDPDFLNL